MASGVRLGTYKASDGFSGSATLAENEIRVTGKFQQQPDSVNDVLGFPEDQNTGFYLPLQLVGIRGQALKRVSNGKINVFGQTGDTTRIMNLILSVDPEQPTIQFKLYSTLEDAQSDTDGLDITVDCSACEFIKILLTESQAPSEEELSTQVGVHQLKDLVGDDYSVSQSNDTITVSGTLNYINDYEDTFPDDAELADVYVPVILTAYTGDVLKYTSIGGQEITKTFGTDGVLPISAPASVKMSLVIPMDSAKPTQELKIYENAEEAAANKEPQIITVDISGCKVEGRPHYKISVPDPETSIGDKTVADLETNLVVGHEDITGTINWLDKLTIKGAELSGHFLVLDIIPTDKKTTISCDIKNESGVIIPRIADETKHYVYKLPADLTGYTLVITQTIGEEKTEKVYDLSKLVLNADPTPPPTLTISAPEDTEEFYGVKASKFQSGITKKPTNRVAGTLHYMKGMGGFGGDQANGFFLALKFDSNATKLTTEVIGGSGNVIDATEDKYCVYRIQDEKTQSIKVTATTGDEVTERILSLTSLKLEVKPEISFVNLCKATKWGFAKTNTELDTLIEPGESAKIDHDSDIFYAAYTKPEHNVVMNVEVAGTQYAYICDDANGSLVGAGASTSGHASDFDFKSDDGKIWTKNEAAVEVAGKTVTMSLYTYAEDVTKENGLTVLATAGNLILGPQDIDCSSTQAFEGYTNVAGVEKFGFLPMKAAADSVEAGASATITHNSNIFFYKLKNKLEVDGKKYAMLIEIEGKTYAVLSDKDAYQTRFVSLSEPTDAALVSSDKGASWEASPEAVDAFGKHAVISVVKAEEDITPENGTTVLKTAKRVFGTQEFTCNAGLVLNT